MKFTDEQRRTWLASLDRRFSSAAVLIENEQGELLIVKSDYKDHWSLPGGIVDSGESPLKAAVREVEEEVGIKIDAESLQLAMVASRHSDEFLTHQFVFFTQLENNVLSEIKLQESEIVSSKLISKSEVDSDDASLLWAIRTWAADKFGYVNTKIIDENGVKNEQIEFFAPMFGGK